MQPKQYINGILTNFHRFGDGNEIVKLSIPIRGKTKEGVEYDNLAAFEKQLRAAAKNGWVNLSISPCREPKKNKTHNIIVDTFEPKSAQPGPQPISQKPAPEQGGFDDVPF